MWYLLTLLIGILNFVGVYMEVYHFNSSFNHIPSRIRHNNVILENGNEGTGHTRRHSKLQIIPVSHQVMSLITTIFINVDFVRTATQVQTALEALVNSSWMAPQHPRHNLEGSTDSNADSLWGEWGPWSRCSRMCTARRYRQCRAPSRCGHEIVKDQAYCYFEGGACHHYVRHALTSTTASPNDVVKSAAGAGRFEPPPGILYGVPSQNGVASNSVPRWVGIPADGASIPKDNCGSAPLADADLATATNMVRVAGGRSAAPGAWPWMVAVLNRYKEIFCGGTLISSRWVLTAAHCLRRRLYVRLGVHNVHAPQPGQLELKVMEQIAHPRYDADLVDHDVALLRLLVAVTWMPACLPSANVALPLAGTMCVVLGWGRRQNNGDPGDAAGTGDLHQAQVPLVSGMRCRAAYRPLKITKSMFCAGDHRDACEGDSGGPLLCKVTRPTNNEGSYTQHRIRWEVLGVTSFGDGCGRPGRHGIYAKVSSHENWIRRTVSARDPPPR